mgnify:CR=1 FL=1
MRVCHTSRIAAVRLAGALQRRLGRVSVQVETAGGRHGDEESHVVYRHACEEAALGLTGQQVIHPHHIHICKVAFTPSPGGVRRNIAILKAAVEADALMGGAIKFEGEMLDPPMFGKALQSLLRARTLRALSPEDTGFALEILKKLPLRVIRENWPYGTVL